jgi:hypothetical protein
LRPKGRCPLFAFGDGKAKTGKSMAEIFSAAEAVQVRSLFRRTRKTWAALARQANEKAIRRENSPLA